MGVAIVILYLAWMIGAACESLGTATYLSVLLGDQLLAPALPSLLFLLGAAVAFSTGSSWSTMSILLPLVVGLAYTLGRDGGFLGGGPEAGHLLMVMSIGAVLEGSIFGDHCSPISDTTVLSSTASASDHIDHVRTQAPYALTVMAVAVGLGYLPCAMMGLSPWLALAAGAAALVGVALCFGRRVPEVEGAG
jgi:Na+/H+ antiporter NhaC